MTLKDKIAKAENTLRKWEANIKFITERLNIQSKEGYEVKYNFHSVKEKQYTKLDLEYQERLATGSRVHIENLKYDLHRTRRASKG